MVLPEGHELLPRDDLHRDTVAVLFVRAFHRVDVSLIIGWVESVVQSPALTHVAGNLHVQGLPVVILDVASMDETFGTKAVVVRPVGLFFFFGADLHREMIVPGDVGLLRTCLWAWEHGSTGARDMSSWAGYVLYEIDFVLHQQPETDIM